MSLKPLPVGIQSFADLIKGGCVYVDKTERIHSLAQAAKGAYFLSRPRRFGKSLLISTLQALFAGQRQLFEGLWIAQQGRWDWQRQHPVMHIDMTQIPRANPQELEQGLAHWMREVLKEHQLQNSVQIEQSAAGLLRDAIRYLCKETPPVLLIDEYDAPLVDHVGHGKERLAIAQANRAVLKEFYSVLKAQSSNLRFLFVTGVSKFAHVSIFSGLSNLDDISMTQDYATLLGYTQQELETYFATHIKQLAAQLALSHQHCLDTIRLWYNGYRFSRKQVRVYNPFSTLLLLRHREFHPHWFATGTPTFLIELLKQRPDIKPQQLSNCQVDQEAFLSYNLEHIEESLLPLLVQTGYLTIDSCTTDPHTQETTYRLNYPNQEVRNAMLRQLLQSYSGAGAAEAGGTVRLLAQALRDNNLPTFFKHLRTLFACVPYDMHIAKESYYQSLFHLIHQLLGFPTAAQVHTNIGRIDSVVHTDKRIYIFEFKMGNVVTSDTTATVATQTDDQALATATVHDARGDSDSVFADEQQPPVGDVLALKALRQMKAKRYYEQYLAAGKEIVLVGAGFVWQWQDDSGKPARPVRQVTAWVSEVVAV